MPTPNDRFQRDRSRSRTGRQRLEDDLTAAGWRHLSSTARQSVFYRWQGRTRRELCLVFDAAQRLDTWSEWHNVRAHIDTAPGRRNRLVELVANDANA